MGNSKLMLIIPCKTKELCINITLQCGQSFRWREGETGNWTGMIKDTVWTLTQDDNSLHCLLHNYDCSATETDLTSIKKEDAHNRNGKDKDETRKRLKQNNGEVYVKVENADTAENGASKRSSTLRNTSLKEFDIKPIRNENSKKDTVIYNMSNTPKKVVEYYTQIVKSYFRLDVSLADLYSKWSKSDKNFALVAPSFPGIRMLDQPAVENVFSFICSSNNNIVRISQLVEKLCDNFGIATVTVENKMWHSFPTVDSLCRPGLHDQLKSLGFGYRAKYICQSAVLISRNGGEAWLESLRLLPYEECRSQLCTLTGVGPKVADCICLMSMNHLDTIPVDTHVFQIAAKDYLPELRGVKTVTDKVYKKIANHFRELYGDYAGWAHSVLFSADLQKFSDSKKKSSTKKSKSVVKT